MTKTPQQQELPLLASGLTEETYDTSASAARSADSERRANQRARVRLAIDATAQVGATDDDLQLLLHLDGSSERPRRWELWRMDLIEPRRDAEGKVVRRLTRTGRMAVVWVTRKAS